MRYFMSILLSPEYDSGAKPVPQAINDAMGPYIEKVVGDGTLISTGGLKRSKNATRIAGDSGKTVATDGPFAEAKEIIGGYAVIEAPDDKAAAKVAAEFVQLHIDSGMPDITVEVRAIDGGYNY
jgi:hypothetical protein